MKYCIHISYEVEADSEKEACEKVVKFQSDIVYNKVQRWKHERGEVVEVIMKDVEINLISSEFPND